MKIGYVSSALDDLEEIRHYLAENAGTELSNRIVDRIVDALERVLVRNPRAGRQRLEFGTEYRSFPIVPYVVFYGIEGRNVYVVRILHGHRDIRPPLASLLIAV